MILAHKQSLKKKEKKSHLKSAIQVASHLRAGSKACRYNERER
jgi:hypothetical protein